MERFDSSPRFSATRFHSARFGRTPAVPAGPVWTNGDTIRGGTATFRPTDLIKGGTATSRPADLIKGFYT